MARTAVITGAARGIGRAVAERLLNSGANVVALDVDAVELDAVWGRDERVLARAVDVADETAVGVAVAEAVTRFHGIDAVVNNAGLHARAYNVPCMEMENDEWLRLLGVNLLGPLNLCRSASPYLRATRGVVVNVSSMSAYAFDPPTAYAVSKAALSALTTCLAVELGDSGVAVVGLAPGLVGTDAVLEHAHSELLNHYLGRQAIGQIIDATDIAQLVEIVVDGPANLITGHTLLADRGSVRGR